MIDITGTDLRAFIAEAYRLSQPIGMGHLHFTPGPISESDIDHVLDHPRGEAVASMDYVRGRAVKMSVFKRDGRLLIGDRWFDHAPVDLEALLKADGVVNNGPVEES